MTKRIQNLFLLFLLTVCINCQSSSSKNQINTASQHPEELDRLAGILTNGPLFIGENHNVPTARDFIIKLIEKGCVQKLFLELDPDMDGMHGRNPEARKYIKETVMDFVIPYYSSTDRKLEENTKTALKHFQGFLNVWENSSRNNPIKVNELIKAALNSKNPVTLYFHDRPGSMSNEKEGEIEELQARNAFSASFIQNKGLGAGTVILAGWGHLNPSTVKKQGHTLQELLGYDQQRVVIYDKNTTNSR